MKAIKLKDLSQNDYERIMKRSTGKNPDILPVVKEAMARVKREGDKALIQDYIRWFGEKNYHSLAVTKKEIELAYKEVDNGFILAIRQMIKNITAVHTAQLKSRIEQKVLTEKGISVWREWRPIERVGLYVPGGNAIYPSSVLMSGLPAKIAGCGEIVLCTPARGIGQIPSATLVAADMIGITKIFKIGGAEAIAAMTYGTKIIPNVYKIFGAGNSYVTAAKMLAMDTVSIDMPAGPSEVFIIADEQQTQHLLQLIYWPMVNMVKTLPVSWLQLI